MRKQGKASQAVCALELSEFQQLIKKCREKGSEHIGHHVGIVYFLLQFHMIAHLDDVMNFKPEDLFANIEIPNTIKSKMR